MSPQPASIAERAWNLIGTTPKQNVWADIIVPHFKDSLDMSRPEAERECNMFIFNDKSGLYYNESRARWDWRALADHAPAIPARPSVPPGAHPRFLDLLDRMREIHIRKARDYGELDANGHNALANMKRSLAMGISPATAAMIRMSDKWSRVQTLYARRLRDGSGPAVADESLSDTLVDLASYALLALILMEEEQTR